MPLNIFEEIIGAVANSFSHSKNVYKCPILALPHAKILDLLSARLLVFSLRAAKIGHL